MDLELGEIRSGHTFSANSFSSGELDFPYFRLWFWVFFVIRPLIIFMVWVVSLLFNSIMIKLSYDN